MIPGIWRWCGAPPRCPARPRICAMRESDSGALASSAATSCLIRARIAVEEAAPPGVGGDMAAEEVLQLVGAARRRHVLLRGDARNGALVHAQRVGDFAQHHRAHRDLAVLEEIALPVDDRLRHAQDGVEALLHVLDQPARFLQLRGERVAAAAARPRGELGVQAVDAQPRHRLLVEARAPDALDLAHHHVGHHVARLDPGEGGARLRIAGRGSAAARRAALRRRRR